MGCGLALAHPSLAAELNATTTLGDTGLAADLSETQPQFVPSIDDLPLMPGLQPLTDADTLFIVPRSGRIADSTAVGAVDIDDVYKFYRRSLPQLGWKIVDGRSFQRGGEMLRIDAHADGKITTVHFSLKPG